MNKFNKYTKEKLCEINERIQSDYKDYLKEFGVKPIKYDPDNPSLGFLSIAYLFEENRPVSKEELTDFVGFIRGGYNSDLQAPRHLATQGGWYIISGKRRDKEAVRLGMKDNEYKLVSLGNPYPEFKKMKRKVNGLVGFDKLKAEYDYRCATCGSKEGEENRNHKGKITKLEQGHMNPTKQLVRGNVIPQCSVCNKFYKDKFIFDVKGRVISVASANGVGRITMKLAKEIFDQAFENNKK